MSEGIKAQYQVLADLKRIEEKIARFQNEIERIPLEIEKLQGAFGQRRQDYDKVKSAFDASEKKLRTTEAELREREDKLHKAEGKMMEVKTNEEYQAAMKENEASRSEKGGLEDQTLSLITDLEGKRTALQSAEKEFKDYEAVVNQDTKTLETERTRLVNLLEEQLQLRNASASHLSPDVRTVYTRVTARIKGVPIVLAENGMCLGCHMKMRPQLYNEVLGYKAIHRCPNCGKIVITPAQDTEAPEAEPLAK